MLLRPPLPRGQAAASGRPETLAEAAEQLIHEALMFQRRSARALGLTPFQLVVLRLLDTRGPQQPSQIAQEFGISRPAVSSEINSLEAGGWVARTCPTEDRRSRRTSLTPKATRALGRLRRDWRGRLGMGLGPMTDPDREELSAQLRALASALRRPSASAGAPAGVGP